MKPATNTYGEPGRELRRDPITGAWVVMAPELARLPGQFLHHTFPDGPCRLCAGHEHAAPHELFSFRDYGAANEPGWRVRVIPNVSPVLRVEGSLDETSDAQYGRMNGVGAHETVVESPDHGQALADLPQERIAEILFAVRARMSDLRRDGRLRYIAAFKDHGHGTRAMSDHGQWQIVGLPAVPERVQSELANGLHYFEAHSSCMVCDVLQREEAAKVRLIEADQVSAVLVPYASRVPFETWIVPRAHQSHFENGPNDVLEAMAGALRRTLRRINVVLEAPAYNVTLQSAPQQMSDLAYAHWRLEVVPHVALGVGTGFEWATRTYVNPTAPEEAARFLRDARFH